MDSLPRQASNDARHALRAISELTVPEVRVVACEFSIGLERMLLDGISMLKTSFVAMDEKMQAQKENDHVASKFAVPTEMQCGNIDDFHHGLEGRIGESRFKFPRRSTLIFFLVRVLRRLSAPGFSQRDEGRALHKGGQQSRVRNAQLLDQEHAVPRVVPCRGQGESLARAGHALRQADPGH